VFKISSVNASSLGEAKGIMERIRSENPSYWPHGLSAEHFDDGLYLIREKTASTPVGFCGFQRRLDLDGDRPVVTGYYSIGVLPEYRRHGFAKEAVSKLLSMKSARCDRMRAMIVASNTPSLKLADSLGVEKLVKSASYLDPQKILERPGRLLHNSVKDIRLDPATAIEHPGDLLQPITVESDDEPAPNGLLAKKIRLAKVLMRSLGLPVPKVNI
jgi:GNAT superfamily N-acetyltransferase